MATCRCSPPAFWAHRLRFYIQPHMGIRLDKESPQARALGIPLKQWAKAHAAGIVVVLDGLDQDSVLYTGLRQRWADWKPAGIGWSWQPRLPAIYLNSPRRNGGWVVLEGHSIEAT